MIPFRTKARFFDSGEAAVAVNFKAGSSTLARAVIAAHHPSIESLITSPPGNGNGTAYPAGFGPDNTRWQSMCPMADPLTKSTTIVPFRDPVEKFRSACAEIGVQDVDALLTALETAGPEDIHLLHQHRLLQGNEIQLYRFPDDLNALAVAAGLSLPLPTINDNEPQNKPTLTPTQTSRVEAIYAEDVAIFGSIAAPGQVYEVPLSPEEQAQQAIKAAYTAASAAFEAMTPGKRALWEPVRQQVATAVLSGDFQAAIDILNTLPVLYEGAEADRAVFLALFS